MDHNLPPIKPAVVDNSGSERTNPILDLKIENSELTDEGRFLTRLTIPDLDPNDYTLVVVYHPSSYFNKRGYSRFTDVKLLAAVSTSSEDAGKAEYLVLLTRRDTPGVVAVYDCRDRLIWIEIDGLNVNVTSDPKAHRKPQMYSVTGLRIDQKGELLQRESYIFGGEITFDGAPLDELALNQTEMEDLRPDDQVLIVCMDQRRLPWREGSFRTQGEASFARLGEGEEGPCYYLAFSKTGESAEVIGCDTKGREYHLLLPPYQAPHLQIMD